MRKTLIALFLAAAVPAAAFAMPGDRNHQRHGGDHGHRMHHELNLSQEQKQQIHKLKAEQKKSQFSITKRYLDKLPEADKKAMHAEFKASREAQQKAFRDLLTAEQKKSFDERQAKFAERRAEHQEFLKWKAEQQKKG